MRKKAKLLLVFLMVLILFCGCSEAGKSVDPNMDSAEYDVQEDKSDSGDRELSYQGVAGDQAYEEAGEDAYGDGEAENGNNLTKAAAQPEGTNTDGTSGDTTQAAPDDQTQAETDTKKDTKEEKLVYTCNLTIETTEYKKTMEEIEKQIRDFSGIIESQNEYDNDTGWYINGHTKTSGTMECTLVVKVPAKDYQAFLNALDGKGKMTAKSMNVTNISRSYYDTQATIESLQIQEKRLLKMMDEAKTIEDMITVEKRLTEVQTQLNQYKTRLSVMDTEVAYSTITMNIREVLEYKMPEPGKKTNTFPERLKNTFEESLSGFLSFMEGLLFLAIRLLPFIIVFGILWFVLKPVRIRFKAFRQARKEARMMKKQEKKEKKEKEKEQKEKQQKEGKEETEGVEADKTDEEQAP